MDWKHGLVAASILMNSMAYAADAVVGCDVLMTVLTGNVANEDVLEFHYQDAGSVEFVNMSETLTISDPVHIMLEAASAIHAKIWKDSGLAKKDFTVVLVEDFDDDGRLAYSTVDGDEVVAVSVRAILNGSVLPEKSPMENLFFVLALHAVERVGQEKLEESAPGADRVSHDQALKAKYLQEAIRYYHSVFPK